MARPEIVSGSYGVKTGWRDLYGQRIGHLPGWYAPETDAAVRTAAADILAGAAPSLPLAA